MANTPDIVIRTAEEREAEDAKRWCLAEAPQPAEPPFPGGITLKLNPKTDAEKGTEDSLVFADLETTAAWASVRARELSLEGVEVYSNTPNEIIRASPDNRFSLPVRGSRQYALARMLKW